MDGLAVSTVPPGRVGMATGIFNTIRISADGVALAVVVVGAALHDVLLMLAGLALACALAVRVLLKEGGGFRPAAADPAARR